jgi:hypothetical protein
MKPLNNYIVERMRVDNIKQVNEFEQPQKFDGEFIMKYRNDNFHGVDLSKRYDPWYYCGYRDKLVFFSPKISDLFFVSTWGISNLNIYNAWYSTFLPRRAYPKPQELISEFDKNGRLIFSSSCYEPITVYELSDDIKDVVKTWKRTF